MIRQPLKLVAEVSFSTVDKKSVDGQVLVRLCNYTDVYYNDRISADMPFVEATATREQIARFSLRAGDVLLTKDSETAGDIGVSAYVAEDLPGVLCGYHLAIARPRAGAVNGRYLHWALKSSSSRGQLEVAATGVTRFGLRHEAVARMIVPTPVAAEQRAIADYLDGEAAKIDSLVSAKRRLISSVFARQDALVDAFVSSQPDASSRADVSWLSRVPTHWPTVSLGLLADVFNGSTPEREEGVGDIAWTTSGEIDQGVVTEPTGYVTRDAALTRGLRVAPPGSILVGLVGQGRTRGLSATLGIPSTLNQNVAAIVPRDGRLDPRYLAMLLRLAYDDLRNGGRGGNQAALNCELLQAYRIPLAPAAEQNDLVMRVERERTRDAKLLSQLRRSIGLLVERRQAVITAAVTGQLEIPGVAA